MAEQFLTHPDIYSQIDKSDDITSTVAHFIRNSDEYVLVTQSSEWEGGQFLFRRQGTNYVRVIADTIANINDVDRNYDITEFSSSCSPSSPQDHGAVAAEMVSQVDKFSTKTGPDGGNLACVWAVRHIAKKALGRWITRTDGTAVFYPELRACMGSSLPADDVPAGGIIISPTVPGNVGHVGLLGPQTQNPNSRLIYSNSSKYAVWKQNFTVGSWVERYVKKKGLKVYTYKLPNRAGPLVG